MLAKNGANLVLCSCSYVAKYPTCFLAVSNRNVQIREMYEICIVDTFDKLLASANCNLPNDSSFMIEQELHLMQQVGIEHCLSLFIVSCNNVAHSSECRSQ